MHGHPLLAHVNQQEAVAVGSGIKNRVDLSDAAPQIVLYGFCAW